MDDDRATVERLLGRAPLGDFDVVVRDAAGSPVVIRNAPFLADGTPMPTRYWLVGPDEHRRVSTLESAGGVRRAEAELPADLIAASHARYAAERDAAIAAGHSGPRPSGGVGGTRTGVKCLHAHYAWFLAGGADPVGAWVHDALAHETGPSTILTLTEHSLRAAAGDATLVFPVGLELIAGQLGPADPPRPEDLTNAIGLVADHLDDLIRADPQVLERPVVIHGPLMSTLASVEAGHEVGRPATLTREAAEDVFRTVATEAVAARRLNPGLPAHHVGVIVAACCAVVAVMRTLRLDSVEVSW